MVNRMTEYKCRRCLKRPNETYRPDPNEVLKVCAECGTENWCLPVRGKTKAKKARKVAESISEGVRGQKADLVVEDDIVEAESVTEATSEVVEEHYLPDGTVLETEKAVNETLTERETLLARLAKLDAEETE